MVIDVKIPNGKSGDWEVGEFTVSKKDASFFNLRDSIKGLGRGIQAGTYKKLTRNGKIIMSNTPAEVSDHEWFISVAEGNVLINGLGLGVVLLGLLKKEEVKSITVIEKSKDVIKLVAPFFEKDSRIMIVHADCFQWKPSKGTRYDFVWHDIWDNICGDNLEEMKKLHRKFGHYTKWQGSWCRDLCERYNY